MNKATKRETMSNENEEAKIKYEKSTHNWALQISVVFTDKDVRDAMPHR